MERVSGFDWDAGNRKKCQKHGVSIREIEALFEQPLMVLPDHGHSLSEVRLKAIGKTVAGRYVFLVFTLRRRGGKVLLRPVSARYMHRKEIDHYENEKEDSGL